MRPVGHRESVVDVEVGQRGELFGEFGVVLRLAGVEAGVFEEHHATVVEGRQRFLDLRADGGIELEDRRSEELFEPLRYRVHRALGVESALGPPEV